MIKVNKETCIGCGLCVSLCPEVFAMDNDNKAYVKSQKKISCIKQAIDDCPVQAISA